MTTYCLTLPVGKRAEGAHWFFSPQKSASATQEGSCCPTLISRSHTKYRILQVAMLLLVFQRWQCYSNMGASPLGRLQSWIMSTIAILPYGLDEGPQLKTEILRLAQWISSTAMHMGPYIRYGCGGLRLWSRHIIDVVQLNIYQHDHVGHLYQGYACLLKLSFSGPLWLLLHP